MRREKPRVLTNPVANHYVGKSERIIEFTFADGSGGLISLTQPQDGKPPRVHVYRHDPHVRVTIGAD